jgi:pimeloyl-ACP methyl ester carboxylesterase
MCSNVSFSVVANTNNTFFSSLPDTNNATEVSDFLYSSLASGSEPSETKQIEDTFTIRGTYCRPQTPNTRENTLQLLVHGITYDKSMWSGLGYSSVYDWQLFASYQGYPTLSIDRLGHGTNGDYPDPFEVVQGPLQVEMLHGLIQFLKSNRSPVGQVDTLAYVGHSYGSSLGNHLSQEYPADVEAYILTGFSSDLAIPLSDIVYYQSAATVDARFANITLGYLTVSGEDVRTASFYGGDFDEALARYDYSREGTVTVGEFLSPGLQATATNYTGNVLVINGDQDNLFCAGGADDCAQILDKTGQDLYPRASYQSHVIANTGHCLTLHRSAPITFQTAHNWLDSLESTA